MKNSFAKGIVRILTYKEKKKEIYYATALEFNLTVSADDETVALLDLQQQIESYIQAAKDLKDKTLLNQKADPILEREWYQHQGTDVAEIISSEEVVSPYQTLSAATRVTN